MDGFCLNSDFRPAPKTKNIMCIPVLLHAVGFTFGWVLFGFRFVDKGVAAANATASATGQ